MKIVRMPTRMDSAIRIVWHYVKTLRHPQNRKYMPFVGPIAATPHLGDQISQTPIFGASSGPRRLRIYRRCTNKLRLSIYLSTAGCACLPYSYIRDVMTYGRFGWWGDGGVRQGRRSRWQRCSRFCGRWRSSGWSSRLPVYKISSYSSNKGGS